MQISTTQCTYMIQVNRFVNKCSDNGASTRNGLPKLDNFGFNSPNASKITPKSIQRFRFSWNIPIFTIEYVCFLNIGYLMDLFVVLWFDLQDWFSAFLKSKKRKITLNTQYESTITINTNILRHQRLQTNQWIRRYERFNLVNFIFSNQRILVPTFNKFLEISQKWSEAKFFKNTNMTHFTKSQISRNLSQILQIS